MAAGVAVTSVVSKRKDVVRRQFYTATKPHFLVGRSDISLEMLKFTKAINRIFAVHSSQALIAESDPIKKTKGTKKMHFRSRNA